MLCYLDYISACRRLHEVEKTVAMLKTEKYSERDVPVQVLAQRDFIKKEKEYYGDECIKWNLILLFTVWLSVIIWIVGSKFLGVF
jgi:hypothetical protein